MVFQVQGNQGEYFEFSKALHHFDDVGLAHFIISCHDMIDADTWQLASLLFAAGSFAFFLIKGFKVLVTADLNGSFGDLEASADVSTVSADFGGHNFHRSLIKDLNAVEP